ncbi:MAG: Maf family protein [Polyangia bacterium]|nr:Maf family protein [Polyangia bacterium]
MTRRPSPPLLLLASASPRRRSLLGGAGIRPLICSVEVDEARLEDEPPEAYVSRLAHLKAEAGLGKTTATVQAPASAQAPAVVPTMATVSPVSPVSLVSPVSPVSGLVALGADTSVVLDGRILGKPGDEAEARQMLGALSGRWHEVLTGWCLLGVGAPSGRLEIRAQGVSCTRVRFKALSLEELRYYLSSGEWRDKAGAYGIQGAAASFVSELRGSYTNVVGLPLAEVVDALASLGIHPAPRDEFAFPPDSGEGSAGQ